MIIRVSKAITRIKKFYNSNIFPLWLKILLKEILKKCNKNKTYENKKSILAFPNQFSIDDNLIGKEIIKNKKGNEYYYAQYYEETKILKSNSFLSTDSTHKTETYEGTKVRKKNKKKISYKKKSLLPISILDHHNDDNFKGNLRITKLENIHEYNDIQSNRFHPFLLDGFGEIELFSNHEMIIGKLLELQQSIKTEKKLVLVIFADGLGSSWFQMEDIKSLIPNTIRFFEKGIIFENCFSNAEWTLPSLASIFTGKYVHNSNIFHPRRFDIFNKNTKNIGEYFQDAGYFTQLISGNRKQHLKIGYCSGFDRTIYKHNLKHHEIIYEFIESHRVFKDRSIFNWLSFFDTHHHINGSPSFSSHAELSLNGINESLTNYKSKSPFSSYCPYATERYKNEIKQWDYHLSQLYSFIEENYNESEILVTLISDHGNNLTENINTIPEFLNTGRLRVPFMLRGNDLGNRICNDFIENVDILPSLLSLSNINYDKNKLDGKLPKILGGIEKNHIFSESIYPNQTYKATLKDKDYEFYIEAKNNTKESGYFNLKNPKLTLYKNNNPLKIEDNNLKHNYLNSLMKYNIWNR